MNFEKSKILQNIHNNTENQNSSTLSRTNNTHIINSPQKNRLSNFFPENNLNQFTEYLKNLHESSEYNLTDINSKKSNSPMNLKFYNKSNIENILPFTKSFSSKKKISLIKRPKMNNINNINNISVKPSSTKEGLFKTEINEKFINEKIGNRKSDFSSTFSHFFKNKKNNLSLRNDIQKDEKEKTKDENALLIPKEDLIFDEMKNYKCFKYFTKESLARTSVPLLYINMDMNTTKNPPKKNRNKNPYQINFNNDVKKFIEYDDVFLSKQKKIYYDDEKKKKILNDIYKAPKDEDMYDKINSIKLKKDKKKLRNYQYYFLKLVKHNIHEKYYEDLRNKFTEIRNIADKKYKTNFKFIKEIEKNEEKVIKNINKTYESFMKFSSRKTISKLLNKKGESKLDLPQIKFEKIINTDLASSSPIKKENHKNEKSTLISLSENKNMNRTSIKIKKKSLFNMNNINSFSYNKNNIMKTSPKTFTKFKFFKDKI